MKHTVYLLLGSNMGDSLSFLNDGRGLLAQKVGEITQSSSIYKTEPWEMEAEQWFHNQVIETQCQLEPKELLKVILSIEEELGRKRSLDHLGTYSSRTIDIDILYYDSMTLSTDSLVIPHPRLQNRRFVLEPMCEIAPLFIHPILRKNQLALLDICTDHSTIERI